MRQAKEIRAALKDADESQGPHYRDDTRKSARVLAAAVRELYEAHKRSLKEMDRIDILCDMAGVHRFARMRADLEGIVGRYRAALQEAEN